MWYEFITLQWRHMSVMVSQVMVNSTALSTGCWENIKTQHYMPWWIHRWLGCCVVTHSCSSSVLQKSLILNEDIYEVTVKHWGRAKMADIFQTTFLKALYWMKMYKFRLRFHGSLFLGVPALVHIITWRRVGDKPLSEPMMICLLTHICFTRPQWVKDGDVLQLLSTIQT